MTIHREQGALVAPVACASRYGRLNVTHMREMFDEGIEDALRYARAALAAREGDGVSSVCEAVAAAKLRTA